MLVKAVPENNIVDSFFNNETLQIEKINSQGK